jgi:hypothetical protein
MKTVALKYCGGCDCSYDRTGFAKRLLDAAEGRIRWVTMDDGGFDTILMIHGCPAACPEDKLDPGHPWRVVSVRDDSVAPEEIVMKLID